MPSWRMEEDTTTPTTGNLRKVLRIRQWSQPLPSTSTLRSQNSSGTLRAGNSDGGGMSLCDDMLNSNHHPLPTKKSSMARLRAFGSIRGSKHAVESSSELPPASEAEGLVLDSLAEDQRKRLTDRAIRYFNLNPKVGLKFIREKRLVASKREPADVVSKKEAAFLKTTKGLNKVKVGQVLCSEPLILREYMALFDFQSYEPTALGVERGLREMLKSFKPGGEGQQLERIMEAFAERFALCCEQILSKDAVLTIAIMILMLNTALHNPNNKHGIFRTKEEFVSVMSKEPLVNESVTHAQLSQLYDDIQRDEIRHDDDRDDLAGNLFSDPDFEGWLDVKMFSGTALFPLFRARWKRRYVILSQNVMYIFKKSTDVDFAGFITLENVRLLIDSNVTSPFSRSSTLSASTITARTPAAELFHPSTQRMVQQHIDQHRKEMKDNESEVSSNHQSELEKEDAKGKVVRGGKPARLISWSSFRTAQSSVNSSSPATTSISTLSKFSMLKGLFKKSQKQSTNRFMFILSPATENSFVKGARLSKRNKMMRNGELVPRQFYYVAFRTSDRAEYDHWVRTLRDAGVLRGKAVVNFYRAISDTNLWTSRNARNSVLIRKYSLPASFSDIMEVAENEKLLEDQENHCVDANADAGKNQMEAQSGILVVA